MRKQIFKALTFSAVLAGGSVHAQEWMEPNGTGTINLEEVKARFEDAMQQRMASEAPDESGKIGRGKTAIREGHNYHFDRWYWHAYSHTDEAGNLVSPLKTYQEYEAWKALRSKLKTTNNASNWTFIGPSASTGGYRGLGRITTVAFHPTDTAVLWVATAGGGAWRSENSGMSWTNMTGGLSVLGTSDVDINPLNPDVIYLCTGDKDAGDTYSIGVLKSIDGGATWNQTGLQFSPSQNVQTNELVINALDTAHLILATSQGIYRSLNGGATWNLAISGNYKQVVAHPTDTAVLYACGSSSNSSIIRSRNGGATWSTVASFNGSTRARVAVSPAAPNMVKAIVANSSNGLRGIYSSHDTGSTFALIMTDSNNRRNLLSWDLNPTTSSSGGQGWYDLAIAVSPVDSNTVFVGGVNTWRSTNGGTQWSIVNHWVTSAPGVKVVHADKHDLRFHPLKPSVLFECNDGGIYRTEAPTVWWSDITNGLGITQFYRLAISDTAGFAVAGAQDNGTKKVQFSGSATDPGGGDGMNCEMDPRTPNTFYYATQYGNLRRTDNGGGSSSDISSTLPAGAWITPYKLHPRNPSVIVAGMENLYANFMKGSGPWTTISNGFNGSTDFRRLELAGNDPNLGSDESYVYCLWNTNQIRWSRDFGSSWNTAPSPGGNVSDIHVDPWDSTHIWVTMSGYSAGFKVAEWYADTLVSTPAPWLHRHTGLPNVPVHCIEIDEQNGTMYVGTDVGVFFRDTSMSAWEPYNANLPRIEVTDIHVNYKTNEVWASTYGRGLWKSPRHLTVGPEPTAVTIVPMAVGVLTASPNPSKGEFRIATGDKAFWSKPSTVRLYDAVGRVAWMGSVTFDGGGQTQVQASGIAQGQYILEVTTNAGALARTRVVVLP